MMINIFLRERNNFCDNINNFVETHGTYGVIITNSPIPFPNCPSNNS